MTVPCLFLTGELYEELEGQVPDGAPENDTWMQMRV